MPKTPTSIMFMYGAAGPLPRADQRLSAQIGKELKAKYGCSICKRGFSKWKAAKLHDCITNPADRPLAWVPPPRQTPTSTPPTAPSMAPPAPQPTQQPTQQPQWPRPPAPMAPPWGAAGLQGGPRPPPYWPQQYPQPHLGMPPQTPYPMQYHPQQVYMQQQQMMMMAHYHQMRMRTAPPMHMPAPEQMMTQPHPQAHYYTPGMAFSPMTPQPSQQPHALPAPTQPQPQPQPQPPQPQHSSFAAAVREAGGQLFPYSELPGGSEDDAAADDMADARGVASTTAPERHGGLNLPAMQPEPTPTARTEPPTEEDEPTGPDFFLAAVVFERGQMARHGAARPCHLIVSEEP